MMLFQQVAPVAPPGSLADPTNVGITLVIVAGLVFAARSRSILDGSGIMAATLLGVVVGLAGHWSWLVLLLTFLLSGHLVTKWRLDEKLSMGMGESSDGHRSWRNVVANGGVPRSGRHHALVVDLRVQHGGIVDLRVRCRCRCCCG